MKSNLDAYLVQSDKDETRYALRKVDKDSLGNILYLNCWCDFTIGEKTISNRLFDKCFYSEDSDVVIFFSKGKITEEEIEAYLEEFDIKYTTIRFEDKKDENYRDDSEFPEVWMAREKYVLEEAIDHSLSIGNDVCIYYPEMPAVLSLRYRDIEDNSHEVEGRNCKGVLVFEDKIVLLVNQGDKRNVKREITIEKLLKRKGIEYEKRETKKIKLK